MKILTQIDEDCEDCNGCGVLQEAKYRDNGQQYTETCSCKKCLGTGKKLEWIEATVIGNSLYID